MSEQDWDKWLGLCAPGDAIGAQPTPSFLPSLPKVGKQREA